MLNVVKEPLLHFVILGSLLFGLFFYLNPVADASEQVRVSEQKIRQLNTLFTKKWQRQARAPELKKLIDDYVLEEIYYREALVMQMDKNDTVIRRRLRQKMEFLMADISTAVAPTDRQLQIYLDQHASEFEIAPRYSFRQIYFDINPQGDSQKQIAAIQRRLAQGQKVQGDLTMLPKQLDNTPANRVDAVFGQGFAKQLAGLDLQQWQGPIRSSFGLHWIYLEQRQIARQATLAEVYAAVKREYAYDLQLRTQDQVTQKLLKKYTVTIQWPLSASAADTL